VVDGVVGEKGFVDELAELEREGEEGGRHCEYLEGVSR
jgi:hypothetical protein